MTLFSLLCSINAAGDKTDLWELGYIGQYLADGTNTNVCCPKLEHAKMHMIKGTNMDLVDEPIIDIIISISVPIFYHCLIKQQFIKKRYLFISHINSTVLYFYESEKDVGYLF